MFQDYVNSVTGDPCGRRPGLSEDNEFAGMYKQSCITNKTKTQTEFGSRAFLASLWQKVKQISLNFNYFSKSNSSIRSFFSSVGLYKFVIKEKSMIYLHTI